jgi:hypothetical protein
MDVEDALELPKDWPVPCDAEDVCVLFAPGTSGPCWLVEEIRHGVSAAPQLAAGAF